MGLVSLSYKAGDVLIACHDCDLLLADSEAMEHRVACCPRCDAVLHVSKVNSLERALALSITGLLLFLPANLLPMLTFEVLGQSNSSTMLNGIYKMAQGGYWWMSVLVGFCSVVAPLLKLLTLSYVSAGCLLEWKKSGVKRALKLYQRLNEWGMFDVYMLGFLVAFIKMNDLGGLVPGTGLYCFITLLVVATACNSVFDNRMAWFYLDPECDSETNHDNH